MFSFVLCGFPTFELVSFRQFLAQLLPGLLRWPQRKSNPRPKLGKLNKNRKNARFGGFLTVFQFFKWIPIGAAHRFSCRMILCAEPGEQITRFDSWSRCTALAHQCPSPKTIGKGPVCPHASERLWRTMTREEQKSVRALVAADAVAQLADLERRDQATADDLT